MSTKVKVLAEETPGAHIKYVHCRNKAKDGSVTPHGGLTIAYVLNDAFKVVGFASAKCHTKDNYNKHVGRMKAAGRLLSATYYVDVPETDEKTFIQQAKDGYAKQFAE